MEIFAAYDWKPFQSCYFVVVVLLLLVRIAISQKGFLVTLAPPSIS
jgi:hypothetical protein